MKSTKGVDASPTVPHRPVKVLGKGLGVLAVIVGLLLMTTVSAFAATVRIYDNARVLNNQVQSEAQSLGYPMDIYTITNYTAPGSSFDQAASAKRSSNNMIVMAINTTPSHQHVYITGGSQVPLTSSDYSSASSTFASNYKSGGYNGAAIAAIDALRNALNTHKGSGAFPGSSGGGGFFNSALCCIGVLVVLGVLFFVIVRRRRGPTGGFFNRNTPPPPPPYNPNPNPYNQPQPPYGGYNQGYPPNQGGGMNPWAAGGLGAAAGGLVGYELGKQSGENEERREDWNQGNDQGGGNNFGGGGGADFGGGNDFGGGGGGDFGGGSDFGGGGDFGGGNDSGGGSNF